MKSIALSLEACEKLGGGALKFLVHALRTSSGAPSYRFSLSRLDMAYRTARRRMAELEACGVVSFGHDRGTDVYYLRFPGDPTTDWLAAFRTYPELASLYPSISAADYTHLRAMYPTVPAETFGRDLIGAFLSAKNDDRGAVAPRNVVRWVERHLRQRYASSSAAEPGAEEGEKPVSVERDGVKIPQRVLDIRERWG